MSYARDFLTPRDLMTVPPPTPSYDVSEPVSAPPLVPTPLGRSSGEAASDWFERNGRNLGTVALVAAVATAGGFAWRASQRASADRAERALYEAEGRFASGDPSSAQALQQIVSRYGDTPAGAHARVLLAQTYYDQGKFADGLRVLGGGSVPSDWQRATEELRAVGEAGSGQPKQAASTMERLAAERGPDGRVSLLADAARAYTAAGDKASARRVWKQVAESGIAGAADEARLRLGELEGTAP